MVVPVIRGSLRVILHLKITGCGMVDVDRFEGIAWVAVLMIRRLK